ncbi:alpha/beta hydrolase [Herbaspirillum rubrisubalbicans]|nr:alpha/beta fold hydrolase [Herbaspirillum rubrisubalbicans]
MSNWFCRHEYRNGTSGRWWRVLWMIVFLVGLSMNSDDLRAQEVNAEGPRGKLVATMLLPAQDGGAMVLILPGSGPTDRDGNGPGGLRASTYRLLAQELLARDIASVRIDKRGMFGSTLAGDPEDVRMGDYVDDVAAWISAIRARSGASCVWLLGHSEGGLVALAAGRLPAVCGVILAATPGWPLGRMLEEQLRANPANVSLLDNALAVLRELESGRAVPAARIDGALMPLLRPSVQGFLMSLLALEPAAMAAAIERPLLILQGRRDIQVGVTDAVRLKQASAHAELVILEQANHVLKPVASDDRVANIATYGNPDLPLDKSIVPAIADFIARHSPPVSPPQGSISP